MSGCETTHSLSTSTKPEETTFSTLWRTCTLCQTREDADQMWTDALRLHRAVLTMRRQAQAAQLLPATIEQALAELPPRLAVDPQAMAAACTLLAGQAAQYAGRTRFAAAMFRLVLSNFGQPRYAYYRTQAHKGLDQINGDASEQVVMMLESQPSWPQ